MFEFALIAMVVSVALLTTARFNAILGALFGFVVYHHSLVLIHFLSKEENYSDWVSSNNTELAFIAVLVLIIIMSCAGLLSFSQTGKERPHCNVSEFDRKFVRLMSVVSLIFIISIFILFRDSLMLSKQEIIVTDISFFGLMSYGFMIVFLIAFLTRDWVSVACSFSALLLLSIFLISRSTMIIPLLGAAFYQIYNTRIIESLSARRLIVLAAVAFFATYGKLMAVGIRIGSFTALSDSIRTTSAATIMEKLEGYAITSYLIDIINHPRPYDIIDSLDAALQFLIFPSIFGADSQSFTRYLEENYRTDSDYGLAYTYFGEGYAVAGIAGVVLWTFMLTLILWVIHKIIIRSKNIWITSWACFALGTFCFYYPRNSLEVSLTMLRLAGLSAFVCFLFYMICRFISKRSANEI